MRINVLLKSICLILVFSLALSTVSFAAEEPWDKDYKHTIELSMPITPDDGYVSDQNPPSFKWTLQEGATYEVVIAKDRELTDSVWTIKDWEYNYILPNIELEEGVPYFWSIRYTHNGKTSTWAKVREFRINPGAHRYEVPTVEEMIAKIPKGHPRIWVTADRLEKFRTYKDTNKYSKEVYDNVTSVAYKLLETKYIAPERPENTTVNFENANNLMDVGFAYLLTGDKELAYYARDIMLELATWDYVTGPTSYGSSGQDQVHRSITMNCAIVCDWICEHLQASEKKAILDMIKGRAEIMVPNTLGALDNNPFNSHPWSAYGYMGIIAIATYGEIPEAEDWLKDIFAGYPVMYPTWGYEDGGWAQGTGYSKHSRQMANEFMWVLKELDIVDMYQSAFTQNSLEWYLYAKTYNGQGSFGDENFTPDNGSELRAILADTAYTNNPETQGMWKWVLDKFGGPYTSSTAKETYWLAPMVEDIEPIEPQRLQLGHEFHDIGWVHMTNDIIDPNRILLTMRSSPWGSFNHSDACNNAFFIEAFGEQLAFRSGYYDSMFSTHDKWITSNTGAHNTITVATNVGQKIHSITYDGKITGFLTQQDFDLGQGDATNAYAGSIDKFVRSIIYIRPDIFVIVDDLDAADQRGGSDKFEWWLNAKHAIKMYDNGRGCQLNENGAVLDCAIQYPENVTAYYTDRWELSDMVEYPPVTRFQTAAPHTRVWFETERVEKTKIIATLDVHREAQRERYVDTEYFDTYTKMTFEDGTVVLVNMGDADTEVVTADGITFTGQVVVFNDESIMLVGGTSLKQGDDTVISLEKTGSVVVGKNELSISTYEDNKLSVNMENPYVGEITKVTDYNGREISDALGITWEKSENTAVFTMRKDNYQLMLNGKYITGGDEITTATVVEDGVEHTVEMKGYLRRDDKVSYTGSIALDGAKKRILSLSDGLSANTYAEGTIASVSTLNLQTYAKDGNRIELETIPAQKLNTENQANFDEIKGQLAAFKEAEDFTGPMASGATTYSTRKFLSGGVGVQLFNTIGSEMSYEFDVKEEGDYSFVVKYVCFTDGGAGRNFMLDGKYYSMDLARTESYGATPEEWRAAVTQETIHLTPGTHKLTLDVSYGSWNIDWLGLLKK